MESALIYVLFKLLSDSNNFRLRNSKLRDPAAQAAVVKRPAGVHKPYGLHKLKKLMGFYGIQIIMLYFAR